MLSNLTAPKPLTEDTRMQNEAKLKRLKTISTLLDSQFEGPFGFRFGLDGILGLFPVVGDLVTTVASIFIVVQAGQMGCSPSTLIRMAMNIVIENVLDMIPIAGSIFDFIWKSNNKNIALLESHLRNPRSITLQSRAFIILLVTSMISFMVVSLYISFLLIQWLWVFITNF